MICNGENVLCLDHFMFQASVHLTLCVIFKVQLSFPVNVYVLLNVHYDINYLPDTNLMHKISLFT